jgi:hypothetical protein
MWFTKSHPRSTLQRLTSVPSLRAPEWSTHPQRARPSPSPTTSAVPAAARRAGSVMPCSRAPGEEFRPNASENGSQNKGAGIGCPQAHPSSGWTMAGPRDGRSNALGPLPSGAAPQSVEPPSRRRTVHAALEPGSHPNDPTHESHLKCRTSVR